MTSNSEIRYWDDFVSGQTLKLGSRKVTREEIIKFAKSFDPQPFHLEEAAAQNSEFRGLAASGWHSCIILQQLIADGFLNKSAHLQSPGVEEVFWRIPVRPDEVLAAFMTVEDVQPLADFPNAGLCRIRNDLTNQHGQVAMTWICTHYFEGRPQKEN